MTQATQDMGFVRDIFWGDYSYRDVDDQGRERDYIAEVGTDAIIIVKRKFGSTDAEWMVWVFFDSPMKQDKLSNQYGIRTGKVVHETHGGTYATGQSLVLFFADESGREEHTFLVAIDQTMAPDMIHHPLNSMEFKMFEPAGTTPAYATPRKSPAPGTPKTAPMPASAMPSPYTDITKKLSFDDEPIPPSSTNTALLAAVGLMVVAVAFYGMKKGKRR